MTLLQQLNRIPFFIKLFNKEYWPMWATYFPVYFYFLYLAAKARSFFFWTATNPSIETGGMFGESKMGILDKIPETYKPISLFIEKGISFEKTIDILALHKVEFPIVLKPNIGERGFLVEKINTPNALKEHLNRYNSIDFIIQPFIDYDLELAIMFHRMPNENACKVISVTQKEFLSLTGDGTSTLLELIMAYPRAVLQYDKLIERYAAQIDTIIPKNEVLELEPIGNHSRGTKFLNGNHLIDDSMEKAISKIALELEGIYFGRFDLKCRSIEDLKQGKHIQILEINGVGAEPAHIYDPSVSLWDVWKAVLNQWTIMYNIGVYNHTKRGVPYMTLSETKAAWYAHQNYYEHLSNKK